MTILPAAKDVDTNDQQDQRNRQEGQDVVGRGVYAVRHVRRASNCAWKGQRERGSKVVVGDRETPDNLPASQAEHSESEEMRGPEAQVDIGQSMHSVPLLDEKEPGLQTLHLKRKNVRVQNIRVKKKKRYKSIWILPLTPSPYWLADRYQLDMVLTTTRCSVLSTATEEKVAKDSVSFFRMLIKRSNLSFQNVNITIKFVILKIK